MTLLPSLTLTVELAVTLPLVLTMPCEVLPRLASMRPPMLKMLPPVM